uniref:Uncharacterized protein n=1 Tax=Vitis vinifera TaxID=29760 RepID=A5APW3_VITVI|nr:hypothetical protein VITISV_020409 [Vitis vinifera]
MEDVLDGYDKSKSVQFLKERGIGVWEDFFKESRSFREVVVEDVNPLPLADIWGPKQLCQSSLQLKVAFRAKVGKRYQLPHKGIIPEEFGVIARYRGQGRLAEPGFRNPRWVDGELVILDGKVLSILAGSAFSGFVYLFFPYTMLCASQMGTDCETQTLQYIKGGPIVGFVYWAPGYHFLVFFNRLMLHV